MNKVVINEFKNRHLIVDIILYNIYAILGFIILGLCKTCVYDVMDYAYALFFMLAFFTLLAYFINRRPINYELLFLGFNDVLIGTFILLMRVYPESGFIISDAILVYAILNVINKLFACKHLIDKKDISFFPKVSVTILLFFIGVLVVSLLHTKIEVGIIILGYYFIIFGLLSLLEPYTEILCGNKTLQEYVFNILSYDSNVEEEKPKVKEVKVSKPKVKKTQTKKNAKKPEEKETKKTNTTKKSNSKTNTTKKSNSKTKSTNKTTKKK